MPCIYSPKNGVGLQPQGSQLACHWLRPLSSGRPLCLSIWLSLSSGPLIYLPWCSQLYCFNPNLPVNLYLLSVFIVLFVIRMFSSLSLTTWGELLPSLSKPQGGEGNVVAASIHFHS